MTRVSKKKRAPQQPDMTRQQFIAAVASAPRTSGFGFDQRNFCGVNLDGLDLHGMDLSFCNFRFASFRGCNLRNCWMRGSMFDRADFTGADLRDAWLDDGTESIESADFIRATFDQANLEGLCVGTANFEECTFIGANLRGVSMADAHINFTNFLDANIAGGVFAPDPRGTASFVGAKGADSATFQIKEEDRETEAAKRLAARAVPTVTPSPEPATDTRPWWQKPPYRLEAHLSLRRGTKEVAGAAVMAMRDYADGPSLPAGLLVAFPTSATTDAGKAHWYAESAIKSMDKIDGWIVEKFDWRNYNEEPEDPRKYTPGDDVWSVVYDHVAYLRELIVKACPLGNRTRSLFEIVDPDIGDHNTFRPPLSALRGALVEFENLAENEQRRILNGWSSRSVKIIEREEFNELSDDRDIAPVLEVQGPDLDRQWSFAMQWYNSIRPVTLMIRPGITKAEALLALDQMRADVDGNWETLITDPILYSPLKSQQEQPQEQAADTTEQPAEDPEAIFHTEDGYTDLRNEMERIADLALAFYGKREGPSNHIVAHVKELDPGQKQPTVKDLLEARNAFYRWFGDDSREPRAILNGWTPDPRPRSRANLMKQFDSLDCGGVGIMRAMCMTAYGPHCSQGVFARFAITTTMLGPAADGIEIQIPEGSTLEHALSSLDTARAFIERDWTRLIVQPENVPFDRSER